MLPEIVLAAAMAQVPQIPQLLPPVVETSQEPLTIMVWGAQTARAPAAPERKPLAAKLVTTAVGPFAPKSDDRWMSFALHLHGFIAGADIASTVAAIESGRGREANPTWAWWFNGRPHWGAATAATLGMDIAFTYVINAAHNRVMRKRGWTRALFFGEVIGVAAYRAWVVKRNLEIATGR